MPFAAPLNSEATPILQWIEVASTFHLPHFLIIGLPSPEVTEARERVRAAIEASGFEFPRRRVVLNLSPASIRKRGTGSDLAMALAVLSTSFKEKLPEIERATWVAWGELGLDGRIKPVGQLARALYAAWQARANYLLISADEYEKAMTQLEWIEKAQKFEGAPPHLIPASNLSEAWEILNNPKLALISLSKKTKASPSIRTEEENIETAVSLLPLPPSLERILGIASAGSHHILILGPKGVGKSHSLEWLIALQPPITPQLQLNQILLAELQLTHPSLLNKSNRIPIRRIGVHARPSALIGSATPFSMKPGEFSLAHGGLLVADELPEWARDSRESLREPLETGSIILTRTRGNIALPARFTLAATGNFCPCGGWPPQFSINTPQCSCKENVRNQYLSKLSGPIMDRIDIILHLRLLAHREEKSDAIQRLSILKEKVLSTREHAISLWGAPPGQLSSVEIENLISQYPQCKNKLNSMSLSSLRMRHKILRLALTLATWDGANEPSIAHLTEAAYYRPEQI